MSLEVFQSLLSKDEELKQRITDRYDIIDFDNGTATIYGENINRYLAEYACKDANDLSDTLWLNYGVLVHFVE